MCKKRNPRSVEQIIGILRDAEVKLSTGMTVSARQVKVFMDKAKGLFKISEQRLYGIFGVHRSLVRYAKQTINDEVRLISNMHRLAQKYPRYGWCCICALLKGLGWRVNHKRIERLWRKEGLQVPPKVTKPRNVHAGDGGCVKLRAEYKNHVCGYDFVHDRLRNGKALKMLTVIEEHSRECLTIDEQHRLNSTDVLNIMGRLFITKGMPKHIRSDNGSEFIAHRLRDWLKRMQVDTAYIDKGSPWQNGYNESFNGKLHDECLNMEIFDTLTEAQAIIGQWQYEYNHDRPHGALGYNPPVSKTQNIVNNIHHCATLHDKYY